MNEVVYLLLLIVFGALCAAALTHYAVRGMALREELAQARLRLANLQEHLAAARAQLHELEADNGELEGEHAQLAEQEKCLRSLEKLALPAAPKAEGRTKHD
ncbi:MAG: hypothetical protein AB1505_30515 [Candidatus Latescibacterota bacterium]